MINALIAQFWPYIALIAAAFAAFFGIRQSGKAAGKQELQAKINDQQAKADKEVRDVQNTVASLDDDAVDSRLDKWVRGPADRH